MSKNVLKRLDPKSVTKYTMGIGYGATHQTVFYHAVAMNRPRISPRFSSFPKCELSSRKFDGRMEAITADFDPFSNEGNSELIDVVRSAESFGFFLADAFETAWFIRQIPVGFSSFMPDELISIACLEEKRVLTLTRFGISAPVFSVDERKWQSNINDESKVTQFLLVRECQSSDAG